MRWFFRSISWPSNWYNSKSRVAVDFISNGDSFYIASVLALVLNTNQKTSKPYLVFTFAVAALTLWKLQSFCNFSERRKLAVKFQTKNSACVIFPYVLPRRLKLSIVALLNKLTCCKSILNLLFLRNFPQKKWSVTNFTFILPKKSLILKPNSRLVD